MKGTIHAIELLAFDLTQWAAHCVELREILAWFQHLNHQRPDVQSTNPCQPGVARGGTVPIKDPALLSLLGTPFDPFAHYPDLKKVEVGDAAPQSAVARNFSLAAGCVSGAGLHARAARPVRPLTPATPHRRQLSLPASTWSPRASPSCCSTRRVSPDCSSAACSRRWMRCPARFPRPRITQASPLGVPRNMSR